MPELGLSFLTAGGAEISRALGVVADATADLTEPLTDIAKASWPIFAERFKAQGPGWAPLSPAYAAWKQKHAPGKPILELTGALVGAMTGDRGWEQHVTAQSLEAGTNLPYAGAHQTGTKRMPARPIIAFTDKDAADFGAIITTYLTKKAEEAGFRAGGAP